MLRNFGIFALLVVQAAAAAGGSPVWPLDLETRYLTGNFMESRGGRYHTAIDLKTEERTGVPVLAVRDGWISRIKFAAGGYGKAVYLTADDGRTYVYAHLERLADRLRRPVERQQADGDYAFDVHLPAGEVAVERGEVIALSGQTATVGPHLHFEVRDAAGVPLDPLRHGFAVPDTIAPEILAVRVWWGSRSYRFGDGDDALAGELPTLVLPPGPVRVSARIVERSDHLRYRLAPAKVELRQEDGRVLARVDNDRVRWPDVRRERLAYRETDLGRECALWNAGVEARGFVDLAGGRTFTLEAADAAGNVGRVRWRVNADPTADAGGGAGWTREPAAAVAAERPGDVLDLDRATWTRTRERGGDEAVGAVVAPLRTPVEAGPDLVGPAVWYHPEHAFPWEQLVRPLDVAMPEEALEAAADPADPRLGTYRLDDGEWSHAGRLESAGGRWWHTVDEPGAYALAVDRWAPTVAAVATFERVDAGRRASAPSGVTLPQWRPLVLPVDDRGSGVDWASAVVAVDGVRLAAEPDPPRDRLLVAVPDDLADGRHRVTVQIADAAGNVAHEAFDVAAGVH